MPLENTYHIIMFTIMFTIYQRSCDVYMHGIIHFYIIGACDEYRLLKRARVVLSLLLKCMLKTFSSASHSHAVVIYLLAMYVHVAIYNLIR